MKVRCIDGNWTNNELTTGKEYEVLGEVGCYYQLKANDKGIKYHCYVKERFEVVKENENMKELTLQEVFNYEEGTIFKMVFEGGKGTKKVRLEYEDLVANGEYITDNYNLKDILKAKYYLLEQWKEIDFYTAYITGGSHIKYVNDNEEIVGSYYYILSKLNSDCSKNGKDISELLAHAKWYIKEDK